MSDNNDTGILNAIRNFASDLASLWGVADMLVDVSNTLVGMDGFGQKIVGVLWGFIGIIGIGVAGVLENETLARIIAGIPFVGSYLSAGEDVTAIVIGVGVGGLGFWNAYRWIFGDKSKSKLSVE